MASRGFSRWETLNPSGSRRAKRLDLPVSERLEGTLVTTVAGVLKGCSFVRVHDVRENLRAVKMAEALKEYMGIAI